jgi:hypothetical protein
VAVVHYTITHKHYTEQHNETEYTGRNIHNNKNTYANSTYYITIKINNNKNTVQITLSHEATR